MPEPHSGPHSRKKNQHDQPSLNLKAMITKPRGNKVFEPVERIAQEEPDASILIDAGSLNQRRQIVLMEFSLRCFVI